MHGTGTAPFGQGSGIILLADPMHERPHVPGFVVVLSKIKLGSCEAGLQELRLLSSHLIRSMAAERSAVDAYACRYQSALCRGRFQCLLTLRHISGGLQDIDVGALIKDVRVCEQGCYGSRSPSRAESSASEARSSMLDAMSDRSVPGSEPPPFYPRVDETARFGAARGLRRLVLSLVSREVGHRCQR